MPLKPPRRLVLFSSFISLVKSRRMETRLHIHFSSLSLPLDYPFSVQPLCLFPLSYPLLSWRLSLVSVYFRNFLFVLQVDLTLVLLIISFPISEAVVYFSQNSVFCFIVCESVSLSNLFPFTKCFSFSAGAFISTFPAWTNAASDTLCLAVWVMDSAVRNQGAPVDWDEGWEGEGNDL